MTRSVLNIISFNFIYTLAMFIHRFKELYEKSMIPMSEY